VKLGRERERERERESRRVVMDESAIMVEMSINNGDGD